MRLCNYVQLSESKSICSHKSLTAALAKELGIQLKLNGIGLMEEERRQMDARLFVK